ncbi:ABC transporter permease [Butyricimonas synergistica]|uniref:ABC transporter permease n=1 Tax=Butyricimonas synergistica TaxID=544644 RepID=UPI00035EF001|nr:ABC transporter permease [Butyricimonas synergistica]
MRMLGFLLQKEFILIFRDKTILLILFLITSILLFILPPAAKVRTSTIALSVVDHDRTSTSASFLRKLTSSNHFRIGAYADTYEEGLQVLEKNKASGILEIPKGFEKNVTGRTQAPIMLEIDAVNGVTAGLSSFYFLQVLERYIWEYVDGFGFQPGFRIESQEEIMARVEAEAQAEMTKRAKESAESETRLARSRLLMSSRAEMESPLQESFEIQQANPSSVTAKMNEWDKREEITLSELAIDAGKADVDIPLIEKPSDPEFEQIHVAVDYRYNPDGESSLYQIPSLLAILVCIIGAVLSALNIVTEKENGTIEQMNVSPVKRSAFIFSKIIPSWIIGMAILTLGLIIVWAMYGIVPQSSYWCIYLVSFLFLVSMVGFGVLISTACRNQQQAMLLCFFFLLIICLLCGMWTPIDSMPGWARVIADINPLRYYIEVMRLFFAYGSELRHVLPQVGALCVFIVVFNSWAIWNFRKAR